MAELEAQEAVGGWSWDLVPLWKKGLVALASLSLGSGLVLESTRAPEPEAQAMVATAQQAEPATVVSENRGDPNSASARVRGRLPYDPNGLSAGRSFAPDGQSTGGQRTLQAKSEAFDFEAYRSNTRHLQPQASTYPRSVAEPYAMETAERDDLLSPALVRGGFSFFAAFCIGLTLRVFFRISMIVCGAVFLALSGLSYCGFIEVHWLRIEDQFHVLTSSFGDGPGRFNSFLQSTLPSGVMGGLGLLVGLKKK